MAHADTARSRIEAQLEDWGAELQKFKAKVDREIADAKKQYYERLEKLREDIETQVRTWGPEGDGVKELRAKIEAELKAWGPQIRALQVAAKKNALTARLGEVKEASDKAWKDVKTGAGKAWDELRPAIQSAITRFK